MDEKKKRLLDNFLSLGALKVVMYIIPLISLPYLSRVLGAEMFGLVFFAFAFVQYFNILTDYGFGLSATREIAINRHNSNNLSNIFSAVMFIKLILVLLSFIILCLCIILIPRLRENWLIFIFSFFMVVGNAIYPVWFFQGMERMKYITFLNILSKTIFLILIFIFVKQQSDYLIVPLLNSLGFIISGIIGMYFAIKHLGAKLYIPKWNAIKKQFKYSTEFFLSRASLSLYSNTNTFFLGLISSNLMVGLYVAAEKIYIAIDSLMGPLSDALYPYIAKYKDVKTYKKIFKYACVVNTFVCVFVFFFAKEIITIIYGAELTQAYLILRIFCLVVLIDAPSILVGFPLLGASGHTKVANGSVITGSVIHMIGLLTLFALNKLNIYSIALMVLITECAVCSIRMFFVFKYKLLTGNKEIVK